jgi:predicted Zn-dependent peptidase
MGFAEEIDVPFHSYVLENGLQVIGETNPAMRSVAVGFFVRTGARDETLDVSGVSHFLEHMVFKGTPRRTALDVNRDFDRIGANYNAFTSEENTVFYASILPEYLPQAVDILSDILRPSLRGDDFDMEKNVIIEEIGMYDDQPGFLAFDHAKRVHFADHPLGNSILGSKESIAALKREQMHAYFNNRYVAPNITVAAAGAFDWDDFVALIERHCEDWPTGSARRLNIRQTTGSGAFEVMHKDKVSQEHVILISAGPPAASPLRYAAAVLGIAVGDDSGSRLYWALVDPGHAETADCTFHEYDGTGSFYTSFSSEPRRAQRNLAVVQRVLKGVQQKGITEAELQQAKNKIASRIVRAAERPMGRMQDIGMTWTYLRKYRGVDEDLKSFDKVTLKTIRQLLDRFPIDHTTTLALGPLKKLQPPKVGLKK